MPEVNFYRFNPQATQTAREDYINSPAEFLEKNYTKGGYYLDALANTGYVRNMGWIYDYRSFLKLYVVKFLNAGLREVYAPNKTAIRKTSYGRIIYIVEIPKTK